MRVRDDGGRPTLGEWMHRQMRQSTWNCCAALGTLSGLGLIGCRDGSGGSSTGVAGATSTGTTGTTTGMTTGTTGSATTGTSSSSCVLIPGDDAALTVGIAA